MWKCENCKFKMWKMYKYESGAILLLHFHISHIFIFPHLYGFCFFVQ